jgi:hypothetical protein
LRVISNRGTQLAYQNLNTPYNPQIEKLTNDVMNILVEPVTTKNALKYKVSRQRLTKAELIGAKEVKEPPKPQNKFKSLNLLNLRGFRPPEV